MSDPNVVERFSDVDFGDELPEFVPDISMEMVRRFGEVTRMTYWRFTDHEKAREAGLPGAIVPGIMSQGILVGMIHTVLQRQLLKLFFQRMRDLSFLTSLILVLQQLEREM